MLDRDKLKRDIDKAKTSSGNIRFVKSGKEYKLRVITFKEKESGNESFFRAVVFHQKGKDYKNQVLCNANIGKQCACCALEQVSETSVFNTRTKYFINAIDMTREEKKVELFAIPTTVWDAICDYVLSEDWKDVLEPDTGHAFVITSTGEKLETEYSVAVTRKPVRVGERFLKEAKDPLTALKFLSFEDQCSKIGVDPDDLKITGSGIETEVDLDLGDAKSETPKSGKTSKSTKKIENKSTKKSSNIVDELFSGSENKKSDDDDGGESDDLESIF